MPDVFLSYSREDQPTARRFADALKQEGFNVWWDQSLDAGESFDKVTERALKDAKAVVVLWSRKAVDSRWVRSEATQADRYGTLVPVIIEPCDRPIMFELTHTADLSGWNGDIATAPWRAFIEGLRRTVGKTASPPVTTASAAPSPGMASAVRPNRRGVMIAAASVAVLVIGAGLLWVAQQGGGKAVDAQSTAEARTGLVTLAVLPFTDMSQAKDQEYFSDGLTEEILNQLAQNRGLRVTGRTSSFSFKGKNEDLRRIAEQLGVANLLEGSIRKDGDNLRINAQLIDGKDGANLWSKTYARELKQVFTVQEEIARDVAQALSITLDVGETSRALGGTTHVEAYDRYLKARSLAFQGGDINSSLNKSIPLLREAVTLDPNFSRAWLALGSSLGTAVLVSPASEAASLRKEAANALDRGITLAPDSFAAQVVGLSRLVEQHRWSEAEALFKKVSASPIPRLMQVEAGGFLDYLMATGHLREVARNRKADTQVEPLSLFISTNLQAFLTATGEFEAAQAEYVRSQALVGDNWRARFRALLRMLYQGAGPQAVQKQFGWQAYIPIPLQSSASSIERTMIDSLGDREAILTLLRQASQSPPNQKQADLTIVYLVADALGDRELALSALSKLVRDFNSLLALWLAPHSGVRSDPRFKQLLRETGLADHFRATGNWGDFCKPVGKDDFECG